MSLSYAPFNTNRIVRILVKCLITMVTAPLFTFLILFILSWIDQGFEQTTEELTSVFLPDSKVYEYALLAGAALGFFISALDLLFTWNDNYKWKRLLSLEPLTALQQTGFVLTHEGLDGAYRGSAISIRHHPGRNTENAVVTAYKTSAAKLPHLYLFIAKRKYNQVLETEGHLVWIADIRGKKKRAALNMEEALNALIDYAQRHGIALSSAK